MESRRKSLPNEFENDVAIVQDRFCPRPNTHLREVNSAETQACDEDVDAISQGLVIERIDRMFNGLWAIRICPSDAHLGMGFVDGHLQRRVCHRKGNKLLPMFQPGESSGGFQPFIK